MAVQRGVEAGSAVAAIPPDPSQEPDVDAFGATSRLAGSASMTKRTTQRPDDTDQCRWLEYDDGVGALEAHVERPAVVPVDDPAVTRDQIGLDPSPLVLRRLVPPRLPEVLIDVYDWKTRSTAEFLGECGLAGPTGTHDGHALHVRILASRTSSTAGSRAALASRPIAACAVSDNLGGGQPLTRRPTTP